MTEIDSRPLSGQTILITGATRGIGYTTAIDLAEKGATLIVHGRDSGRVEQACSNLQKSATAGQIHGVVADLASLEDVRRLARDVNDNHERLDVLINNAGLVTRKREQTIDGLERQLAVNHLAPFLLTHLLLEKLKASAPARIVNVASMAHHRAAFDLDDLNWEQRRYNGIGAYGATKLANILFTRELAKRLKGTRVTANCLHPGVVATNIFTGMGFLGTVFGIVTRPFLISSQRGAETSVYLASSAEVEAVSGRYFNLSKPVDPGPAGMDDSIAIALWRSSEKLVGQID